MAKVFETLFKLKAKYEGKPAFNSLNKDIDRTQRNVKDTQGVFSKAFGRAGTIVAALGATAAAYYAFRKAVDLGKWAFDAAKEQKKAHDLVKTSNEKMVAQGRLSAKQLEQHTQEVIAFGESMSKAGGLDAETLQGGLAELSKSLTWKQIQGMSKGWQDWMVTIHKGAPTMEQAIEDADAINDFIFRGKTKKLEDLGITKEQAAALGKLESAQERVVAAQKIFGKQTGATAAWKKTDAGVTYDAEVAAENLGETLGGPLVEAQRELNEALKDLYVALEPVAELIAKQMTPYIQNLTKYIKEHKTEIAAWGETAVTWITKIVNFFIWLQSKSEEYLKPIWENTIKEWNFIWPKLSAFWSELWANTQKEIDLLWPIISKFGTDLWTNTLKEWEQLSKIVGWIGDNIIMPIYNWFVWLKDQILAIWKMITDTWNSMTGMIAPGVSAVGQGAAWQHQIPQASDFQGGSAGTGVITGTTTSNAGLEAARAAFIEEMKDPAKRARLYARVKSEVGGQGPAAIQKEMETVFNRAWSRRQTIDETVAQGGKAGHYWGGRPRAVGEQEAKVYDLALTGVKSGSDVSNLATGNESAGLRSLHKVTSTAPGGERFGIEPADVKRQRELQEIKARGSLKDATKEINQSSATSNGNGPMNVTMNTPVTVNGVAPGSEELIAQKVEQKLRNNSRANLAQLKRDKNYELRLNHA